MCTFAHEVFNAPYSPAKVKVCNGVKLEISRDQNRCGLVISPCALPAGGSELNSRPGQENLFVNVYEIF